MSRYFRTGSKSQGMNCCRARADQCVAAHLDYRHVHLQDRKARTRQSTSSPLFLVPSLIVLVAGSSHRYRRESWTSCSSSRRSPLRPQYIDSTLSQIFTNRKYEELSPSTHNMDKSLSPFSPDPFIPFPPSPLRPASTFFRPFHDLFVLGLISSTCTGTQRHPNRVPAHQQ